MQSIPRNDEGPVFREPWEAEAFALALSLNERGLFTWKEWAATLGDEIKKAQAAGDPDTGETYYHHWLATLERIVAEKGVTDARHAGAHARRLGACLRAHAARHADRATAERLPRLSSRRPAFHQVGRRHGARARNPLPGPQRNEVRHAFKSGGIAHRARQIVLLPERQDGVLACRPPWR